MSRASAGLSLAVGALLGLLGAGCATDTKLRESAGALARPGFELDYGRLSGPLAKLPPPDQNAVHDAIRLIKDGDHALALARLSSLMDQKNPQNSSLRILASYALLQAGNLLGAFQEAEKAHEAPGGGMYACWFLGKVALLNGNKEVSERELRHLKRAGGMAAETDELEKEIGRRFGPA